MDVSSEFGKVVTRLTQYSEEKISQPQISILSGLKKFFFKIDQKDYMDFQRISWQLYVSYISTFQKMNDEVDDPENEIHLVSLNVITYIENLLYKRGSSDTSFPSKFNMRGCYFLLVYFCLLFSVKGLHFRKYMWVDKTRCLKLIEKVSFNIANSN